MGRNWFHEVFVGIDQFINAVLAGYADETLSARSYRLGQRDEMRGRRGRWWYAWRAIDVLFFWQAEHCKRAYDNEYARTGLPPEYRQ